MWLHGEGQVLLSSIEKGLLFFCRASIGFVGSDSRQFFVLNVL